MHLCDWASNGSANVFLSCGEYGFSTVGVRVINGIVVEFKSKIFSNYCKRVEWRQSVTADIGLSVYIMFWIDHLILSHWYSGVVVGKARWQCSGQGSLPRVGV